MDPSDRLELSVVELEGAPGRWRLWFNPFYSHQIEFRRPPVALGSGPSIGDTAEVVSGRLYLGCHGCLDAAAYDLRIIAVTPNEFWGIWEVPINGSGTVLTDSANRVLPNPAGHYCARRLGLQD